MGTVHPDRILQKSGAKPGDALILTKALGTGVNTTALKNGVVSEKDIRTTVASMKMLNGSAAGVLSQAGISACTDVTGFSLLGHAYEIAENSGVGLLIEWGKLPFLERARESAEAKSFPGGTFRNKKYYECVVRFDSSISELQILMMFTPETSGGLLATVAASRLDVVHSLFQANKQEYWLIGEVVEGSGIQITA